MRKLWFVFMGVFIVSGLLLISCQQQESVQEKGADEHGVAVQTFEKARETMGEYREKTEGAIEQMKEEAAGYGEKTKDAAAGYGR